MEERNITRRVKPPPRPPPPSVLSLVNHTHPAATQLLDDAVVRDGLADQLERESTLRESMLDMLMGTRQGSRTVGLDAAITGCNQLGRPRFCLQGMVNSVPLGASTMKITGLGIDRLRLKLRIMSDEDLGWLFLNRREECSHEFWEELETRKAAGRLSKDSPFWTIGALARYHHPRGSGGDSNLIKLTPEEWEARRRRKMFRLISA